MAPRIYYDDPDLGPIEITDSVKFGNGDIRLTMTAEQGAVSTDTLTVEDPDGIYNFGGLRNIWVDEDSAEDGFQRVYTGWVWVRDIGRGDYYRTGVARRWELQMQDINHVLYKRVMAGNDTDRPEETDVERIQWLLGTGEASGITDTTTYVFTSSPVDMDANPDPGYNGQEFSQVVNDCAEQSGKNYYMLDVFVDYDEYGSAIWYGHDDLDEFVSEATISNVESEVDNVSVFWADVPAKLTRDPSRVWSGVFGSYDGGWVYRQDLDTVAEFTARDTTASWPNVKSEAKANARADRMLADLNTEEDAVTVSIWSMQHSQANVFRAGHRVNGVKFTHFPGWETGRDVRIVRKTLIDQSTQLYRMELDLLPLVGFTGSCTLSIARAEETANPAQTPTFGPVSIPVNAATFNNAQQINLWVYSGPLLGIGGTSITVSGTGWTELDQYDVLGSHTWLGVGYNYQPTIATPANMDVTATSSGGGFPEGFGVGIAFPTSSSAPIQQAPIELSGNATLPGLPTPGNILFCWSVGETSALDPTNWLADGGVLIVDNQHHTGGNLGVGGVYITIGMRCVTSEDTTSIPVFGNAHSHWSGVSEWAP